MWFRVFKLIIWILVISGWVFWWKYSSFGDTTLSPKVSPLIVDQGSTFRSVLLEQGLDETMTKLYLRMNTPDFSLQAGRYDVEENMNLEDFLEALKSPLSETDLDINLTFLEGWNIFDIDEYLTSRRLIEVWDFINYAENDFRVLEWDYDYLKAALSLEGFLYPDTYTVNTGTFTSEILARKMLSNFNTKIYQPYLANADAETIYDLINLASIVEKEERNSAEKSTVAGILKKRWQEGWQIGADITVCYPQRLTSEECKLSVTKYLYEQNDYNTRQMTGLPKTPIGNPSAETFEATLNSKDTPYYFYLHNVDTGKVYYATTNAEHERNKALYLR